MMRLCRPWDPADWVTILSVERHAGHVNKLHTRDELDALRG